MKVGIIGLGVVGSALLKAFKSLGNKCFGLDLKNIKQSQNLTSHIKKIFKDQNYPIIIDQEGGKVNRLKNLLSFQFL